VTKTALVLMVAVLGLAGVGTASAMHPTIRVRPTVASPGQRVEVTGNADGCPRGDAVTIISRVFPGHGFAGIGAITARVRVGGAFSAWGRVRADAKPGRYGITARCGGGNLGVAAYLRVR
jgi:hypothetical protein